MTAAGILLLADGVDTGFVGEARACLAAGGWNVLVPKLAADDWNRDRSAIREIGARADEWRAGGGVDQERLAVVGFGRGGTLAFLLGCAQRFAAVVDVDGPVLYPELGPNRPTQPLELALNLEGELLALFSEQGLDVQQRELLDRRLVLAARPFEIGLLPGAANEGSWRVAGVLERVRAFLEQVL